jgi:hypothetical protein
VRNDEDATGTTGVRGPNKTLDAYFLGTVPITSVPSSTDTFGLLHPILLQ